MQNLSMQKILEKLISFKTISGNYQENQKALNWVKEQIKNLPLYIKDFKINNFASLVITTKKTKQPIIWLQAHMDVVSDLDKNFYSKIIGARLYGRGAFDMKFAIACYIKLLKNFNKDLPKYNFGIMITTDEEIGGFNGTKALLDKGFNSKIAFLPDSKSDWQFVIMSKGTWQLSIQSKGKSSHGSTPWLGKNAIEELIDFLNALRKQFPQKHYDIKNRYDKTLNIGKISGGENANQVPDFAEVLIDIRFTTKTNKVKLEKMINLIKKKFIGIKIKEIFYHDHCKINPNNAFFKLFSKIAYDKFNIETSFGFTHGSSDAGFFLKKKIPIIVIKPKGGNIHTINEWIDLKDLEKFYIVLEDFVKKTTKID